MSGSKEHGAYNLPGATSIDASYGIRRHMEVYTHLGEGAPQSQHLSFPLPAFFWSWWSYGGALVSTADANSAQDHAYTACS